MKDFWDVLEVVKQSNGSIRHETESVFRSFQEKEQTEYQVKDTEYLGSFRRHSGDCQGQG